MMPVSLLILRIGAQEIISISVIAEPNDASTGLPAISIHDVCCFFIVNQNSILNLINLLIFALAKKSNFIQK